MVPVYKKDDKTDCSNYHGISLLTVSYRISSNILLSRLSSCINKITGDHQCGFRRNRSTTDQNFCIRQILEKKLSRTDFKKAYDSVRREVLYSILIESLVPIK
jgi:hypothetical protein